MERASVRFAAMKGLKHLRPLGIFGGVKADMAIPPEPKGLWAKVASGSMDRLDAVDPFKATLKALERKTPTADPLKP